MYTVNKTVAVPTKPPHLGQGIHRVTCSFLNTSLNEENWTGSSLISHMMGTSKDGFSPRSRPEVDPWPAETLSLISLHPNPLVALIFVKVGENLDFGSTPWSFYVGSVRVQRFVYKVMSWSTSKSFAPWLDKGFVISIKAASVFSTWPAVPVLFHWCCCMVLGDV